MLLGPLCGLFIDTVKVYRYIFVWQGVFSLAGAIFVLIVYRRWKALGGPDNYQPP